jgi:hypothetical protein
MHRVLSLCVSTALLLLQVAGTAMAQSRRAEEAEVKAAYLYNFGKFVRWPGNAAGGEFTLCVLGRDPFGEALDRTIEGETIGGISLTSRRIRSVREASGCKVLFVSRSEEARESGVLETLGQAPVLTVSDIPGFIERGGMIEFVNEGSRIRFRINLQAAEAAGLTLSSELLRVATAVRRAGGA